MRGQSQQTLAVHQTYLEGRESWLRDEIAERLIVEQALRVSEAQYRSMMESAPEAILVYDVDLKRIVASNRNAEVLFGLGRESLYKMSLFDLIQPNVLIEQDRNLSHCLDDALAGETSVLEFVYRRPDGSEIPCEARLVQIPSDITQLFRVSVTDISARKKIKQELIKTRDEAVATAARLKEREQELSVYANRLREAIQLTNTGIFDHDHRTSKIYRSPEIQRIYGMSSEVSEQPYDFMEYVHEDDRERIREDIRASHDPNGAGQFHHVYRVITGAGKLICCEVHATTTFEQTEHGRIPVRTVGALMDVTDRIEREQSLSNSRRQMEAILESNYDSVFSLDSSFRYLAFNRFFCEKMRLAYGVEIELGRSMLDCITVESDRQQVQSSVRRALQGERVVIIDQFGEVGKLRTTFEMTFTPMKDHSEHVFGVAVFARDISGQLQSQEALRELEEFQHLAIEASLLGIWKYSSRSKLFTLDERSRKLLGLGESVVNSSELQSRIHPDDLEKVLEYFQRLANPNDLGDFKLEHRLLLPDGNCKWVAIGAVRFVKKSQVDATDETWFIGTLADISELQRTSQLLSTSLQEKEAMLKEIHHRVKNNLQVISSLLSLQASDASSHEVRQFSLESQRRIRAMALVHEMLYQSDSLAQIDMRGYVEKLCTTLIQSYGQEKATIIPAVGDLHLPLDQALPIGLILSELVANAFKHAFPDSDQHGRISIELRKMLDGNILLSVTDDGIGLPEDLGLIEESSLGLRLVNLLARQLRGQLTVNRSIGASFTIEIPHEV
ncbi:MAG: PAS domain S-box protein [Pirellulales bacterium]